MLKITIGQNMRFVVTPVAIAVGAIKSCVRICERL